MTVFPEQLGVTGRTKLVILVSASWRLAMGKRAWSPEHHVLASNRFQHTCLSFCIFVLLIAEPFVGVPTLGRLAGRVQHMSNQSFVVLYVESHRYPCITTVRQNVSVCLKLMGNVKHGDGSRASAIIAVLPLHAAQ